MHCLLTPLLRRLDAAAMLLMASLVVASGRAALDTTALTTDHSINVPTDWWVYDDLTPQQLSDKLTEHSARMIELERYDRGGGQIRYAAVLVSRASTPA